MNNKVFEAKIQYRFKDPNLLERALTHSSYCREHGNKCMRNNERLEFLGDAFLDAIIGSELFNRLSKDDEGKLTKTRALIVCEKSLAKVGENLKIGDFLNLGNGEELSGGRKRASIVADAVEAVVGALYLDGGFEATENFVKREFDLLIRDALDGKLFTDYKTQLQEILQQKGKKVTISYVLEREEGPDHDKTFYVYLDVNGRKLSSGMGKNKKEAEQNAAQSAIEGGLEHVL